jgi:hypothetical protein
MLKGTFVVADSQISFFSVKRFAMWRSATEIFSTPTKSFPAVSSIWLLLLSWHEFIPDGLPQKLRRKQALLQNEIIECHQIELPTKCNLSQHACWTPLNIAIDVTVRVTCWNIANRVDKSKSRP